MKTPNLRIHEAKQQQQQQHCKVLQQGRGKVKRGHTQGQTGERRKLESGKAGPPLASATHSSIRAAAAKNPFLRKGGKGKGTGRTGGILQQRWASSQRISHGDLQNSKGRKKSDFVERKRGERGEGGKEGRREGKRERGWERRQRGKEDRKEGKEEKDQEGKEGKEGEMGK